MTAIEFLNHLNGSNNGKFKQWLDGHRGNLRMAWYPSCGHDMRDLLYMRDGYYLLSGIEPVPQPDLYIHTDYILGSLLKGKFDVNVWFKDARTTMTVKWYEQLPSLNVPFHQEFVDFRQDEFYNQVHVVMMEVVSNKLGRYEVPVILCCVENTAFFATEILENKVTLTHICRIRYGTGLGGAKNDGFWMAYCLRNVGCELFITDNHYTRPHERSEVRIFPAIKAAEDRIFAQLPPVSLTQRVAIINRIRADLSDGLHVVHECHDVYRLINNKQRMVGRCPLDRFDAAYWYKVNNI